MRPAYFLPLLLAGLAWQPAYGAPLYKWIDGAGLVTYSSTPPPAGAKVETMKVPPSPTEEEIRRAQERVKRAQEQAGEMEASRRKQEEKEAEEARLRALRAPPAPIVIEQPVYVPQPIYYPPVIRPPRNPHPDQPPHNRPRRTPH